MQLTPTLGAILVLKRTSSLTSVTAFDPITERFTQKMAQHDSQQGDTMWRKRDDGQEARRKLFSSHLTLQGLLDCYCCLSSICGLDELLFNVTMYGLARTKTKQTARLAGLAWEGCCVECPSKRFMYGNM